jgi:uroporphyrin-III C-methyltransferase
MMKGKVYIVGAGPGDPELLTLKAVRVLGLADVVLHDELVTPGILERVSPAASIFNVGKRCGRKSIAQEEINSLLAAYAEAGMTVVRLHGGDPLIFGRSGEEIRALRAAKVDFEIVPGVTAATSASAAAAVSLTERNVSSAVVLMTGHHALRAEKASDHAKVEVHLNGPAPNGGEAAGSNPNGPKPNGDEPDNHATGILGATFVVYMPADYASVADRLRASGVQPATPCLIVSRASTENEERYLTTLGELSLAPALPAPRILIVGAVVAAARESSRTGGDIAQADLPVAVADQ